MWHVCSDMKRFLCICCIAASLTVHVVAQSTVSQNQDGFDSEYMDGNLFASNLKDSTVVEREVSKEYTQWLIDPDLGLPVYLDPDTLAHHFQNVHLAEGLDRQYSVLGVIGSPRINRIWFDREKTNDFIFDFPYSYNVKNPVDYRFSDAKTPHVSIDYYKSGNKESGEDRIKGYFAANFGKRVGIGFDLDYTLGKGRYTHQSASGFTARVYTYYHGDVYKMHVSYNMAEIKQCENGGVTDDRFITAIEQVQDMGRRNILPEDIPVRMTGNWNNLKRQQGILNQTVEIKGNFNRVDSVLDTVIVSTEKRTVSTIAHTMQIGELDRRHIVHSDPVDYYLNTAFLNGTDREKYSNFYVNNTLSIMLNEGFSKWAFASLGAYIRYEYRNFRQPYKNDSVDYRVRTNENDVEIGAILERQGGKNLNFKAQALSHVIGADLGDYELKGNLSYAFKLGKREARVYADAHTSAYCAPYFMETFHSRNYWWDADFKKVFSNGVHGGIGIGKTGTELSVGFENLNNYVYLADIGVMDQNGNYLTDYIARQSSSAIQVFSAQLKQNFAFGVFHWDNTVTYQVSSNKEVLPLPMLDVYSNLYFKFAYFKRLKFEIGADVSYFTKYYGQGYAPSIGMFVNQNASNRVEVGNYPMINVYANCEVEHVRFYFMCYHLNYNLMEGMRNAFYVPHYPINPRYFQLGLSWTFYD